MLNGKNILITGGTGSFGHTFVPLTLAKFNPRRLVIYSRDEMKQWEMAEMDRTLAGIDYAYDVLLLTSREYERDKEISGTSARYASSEGKALDVVVHVRNTEPTPFQTIAGARAARLEVRS